MLTSDQLWEIENKAIADYLESIQSKRYKGELLTGDIQRWYDADRYNTVPGNCYVDGEVIRDWIIDHFESIVSEFLYKSGKCKSLDEIAEESDLIDEATYYDYVFDKCEDIEDYFWSSDVFEELCNEYFEENGEEIRPGEDF